MNGQVDLPTFDATQAAAPFWDPRKAGALCNICPLRNQTPVPPQYARGKAHLVIVGEAPGRLEVIKQIPFIGPSGSLLNRLLSQNGIDRRDTHVTNALLCRPEREKDIPDAILCCAPRLFKELAACEKVPIAALGAVATKVLLGTKSILRARGFVWTVPTLSEKEQTKLGKKKDKTLTDMLRLLRQPLAGTTVLPALHPAFILRSPTWHTLLANDILRVARFLAFKKPWLEDEIPFVVVSTAKELARQAGRLGRTVTVDVETDGPDPLLAKLVCVGIGDERKTIVAHPWKASMAQAFARIFAKRIIVGHNAIVFDAPVLRHHGVRLGADKVEDTLVAHHAFASHLPKSLLHVASVYCDASPWKHQARGEGRTEKGLPHELPPGELCRYNAADVHLTALSWNRMQGDLASERHVYEVDKRMAVLCAEMREVGFPFDVGRARELSRTLQARKNVFLGRMREITDRAAFSPSKPAHIRKAIFGRLKAPAFEITPTGLPSTSRSVLERLRVGHGRLAELSDLILRWRAAEKTRGTYLAAFVHQDGRVHADWRIGPVTGRLACRLMTLPRYTPDTKTGEVDPTDRVRECYTAGKGSVLVYFDLSQAECRMAAHLSQDPKFIETCRGDVHAGNAKILFPEAAKQGWLDGAEAKTGRGKPFRDIAKNAGFAVTYLAEWETVYAYLTSHGFSVSASDCRAMLDRLHVAYKGYFQFVERNVAFVKEHGYFRTFQLGRIRWFGQYAPPTEVANFPIQAGIADHMNDRLWKLRMRLPAGANILAQVHDAAIIECQKRLVSRVQNLVREIFEPPVVIKDRPAFEIPIDLKVGERWSDFG